MIGGVPQLGDSTVAHGEDVDTDAREFEIGLSAETGGSVQRTAVTLTIGMAGGVLPNEPWKGLSEKLKMPPSSATIR